MFTKVIRDKVYSNIDRLEFSVLAWNLPLLYSESHPSGVIAASLSSFATIFLKSTLEREVYVVALEVFHPHYDEVMLLLMQ